MTPLTLTLGRFDVTFTYLVEKKSLKCFCGDLIRSKLTLQRHIAGNKTRLPCPKAEQILETLFKTKRRRAGEGYSARKSPGSIACPELPSPKAALTKPRPPSRVRLSLVAKVKPPPKLCLAPSLEAGASHHTSMLTRSKTAQMNHNSTSVSQQDFYMTLLPLLPKIMEQKAMIEQQIAIMEQQTARMNQQTAILKQQTAIMEQRRATTVQYTAVEKQQAATMAQQRAMTAQFTDVKEQQAAVMKQQATMMSELQSLKRQQYLSTLEVFSPGYIPLGRSPSPQNQTDSTY
ncbi:hypothetical protein BGZ98_004683 [Dissophora globulifera]|nr:hypothetical protein BGZ98_004683 [Dissophora globulifera]